MSKHVLVIADIDDDDFLSLEKAKEVSGDFSASVEAVKFCHYDSDNDGPIADYLVRMEQEFDATIQEVYGSDMDVTRQVIAKEDIDEWIVERCENRQKPIDLVIKGGHRTESLFHTPTDWKLIRHLHCPILIASHTKWRAKSNVLMTLDLSHNDEIHAQLNELTLTWGELWSQATHTKLHAIYSIPIAKPLLELDIVDKREVEAKEAPEAAQKLEAYLQEFNMENVTCHVPAGPPDKTIPHLAGELHSDLVIMGCVGRDGLGGFLVGNTAEKVLHHIRTDCLIIKLSDDRL